ncbi:MAG TPA: cytochrome-c peroxidase, partial [bacterium]|nr:cytochrome-c peroxidase [bacterium]
MSRRLHCVGSSPRAVVALWLAAVLGAALVAGCGGGGTTAPPPGNNPDPIGPGPDPDPDPIDNRPVDIRLGEALANSGVTPLDPGPAPSAAKVELGRMLYFDKIISGNRDISCSGCHHPTLASADGIPLSIGTGGHNLGPD